MPDSATPPRPATPLRARLRALMPGARQRARPEPKPLLGGNPLRTPTEQRSLFGEILDWMLAPLLLLWPTSVTITYLVAQSIANAPFDRTLADNVTLLADHVRYERGVVSLQLPMSAREVLRADAADNVYYMVLGARGELVAGDADLPLPADDEKPQAGAVQYRSDQQRGNEIRIAYTWVALDGAAGPPRHALVQVGETLEKRSQLANEIIRGVIIPQFIVLPIAVLLVWFGLSRGLAPLNALQARIRAREPDDQSPIDPQAAPEEISPLVVSFNELLERLTRTIGTQKRFMADAAHQMKTPLAGLRTQAELALRQTDPQELRASLRQIATGTERATHLINQLLALARAEHGALDPGVVEVVDLGALARELVRDWVQPALARGHDLGFEPPEQRVRVVGAPLLLRELLGNLVDNALRYTPTGGSVTVRVRGGAEAAVIEVEDTGPGIPESERGLVFDRFYRILGTGVDGSGLGLSIVREIAEQHEARVEIAHNPNATDPALPGTLIRVTLRYVLPAEPTLRVG